MSWNLLYALDLTAITSFAFSYYFNCYRKGYKIDIWHSQVFLICVFPNMLLLPFSKGILNYIVLHQNFLGVVASLPTIFLITLLGYFCFLLGGFLWRIRIGIGLKKLASNILDILPQSSMMVMSEPGFLKAQALLCLMMQAMILAYYFSRSGFGLDLRQFTFENPVFRPIALFISTYSIFIAAHCFARYAEKKERLLLASTLLLSFGLLFFGARGNIVGIYVNVVLCTIIQLRRRISLVKISIPVLFVLMLLLYLGSVRAGDYSLSDFFAAISFLVLYGNNFSDLRDFAWVYSGWDHHFWMGKTYLAAVTAFVPRFASEFRDHWGLGAATAITAGLDPHLHPGLRPGAFGEGYLNFGAIGVVVVGIVAGFITQRIDIGVKKALISPRPSMMKAFAMTSLFSFVSIAIVSVTVTNFYVLVLIYAFNWCGISLLKSLRHRSILPLAPSQTSTR